MRTSSAVLLVFLAAAATQLSCAFVVKADDDALHTHAASAAPAAAAVTHATCVLQPTEANPHVSGVVHFVQTAAGLVIEAEVTGLTPGPHGFHVHEWGDLDCKDGLCTGGHFNPTGQPHASPDAAARHAGDLGNLVADANGVAHYRREDHMLSLNGPTSVIGRGMVVQAGADDFTT